MLTGDQAVNASSTGAFGDQRTMKAAQCELASLRPATLNDHQFH
ncbi:hypothetical protein ABIB75_003704 [Bradyrhizobium sp. GM2.2]|jgi:hypothetical protein